MPVATFPTKLYQMLKDAEVHGFTSIVSWLPAQQTGNYPTAFKVHSKDTFAEKIMPRYFQQTKYKSFVRQLNLWSFQRIQRGPQVGGYWHMLFMKTNQSLIEHMTRGLMSRKTDHEGDQAIEIKGKCRSSSLSTSSSSHTEDDDEHSNEFPLLTPYLLARSNHRLVQEGNFFSNGSRDSYTSGSNGMRQDQYLSGLVREIPAIDHVPEGKAPDLSRTSGTSNYPVYSSLAPQDLKYILLGIEMGKKGFTFPNIAAFHE